MSTSTFHILGGVPASVDLAPSVVFAVAYLLLVPLLAIRVLKRSTRAPVLLRPALFILCQLVAMIVRCIMSQGIYAEGLFIADIVLLTVGTVLIVDPIVVAYNSLLYPIFPPVSKKDKGTRPAPRHLLLSLGRVIRLLLLAIVVTGIVVGSKTGSSVLDTQDKDAQLARTLRTVNYVLSIVVLVILTFALLLIKLIFGLRVDSRKTVFAASVALVLLIPATYKLGASRSVASTRLSSEIEFYILLVLPQWLATAAFLAVPLAEWYPSETAFLQRQEELEISGDSEALKLGSMTRSQS